MAILLDKRTCYIPGQLFHHWAALFIKKIYSELKYVFSFNLFVLVSSRRNRTFSITTFSRKPFKHTETFLKSLLIHLLSQYTHASLQLLFIKKNHYHLGATIFWYLPQIKAPKTEYNSDLQLINTSLNLSRGTWDLASASWKNDAQSFSLSTLMKAVVIFHPLFLFFPPSLLFLSLLPDFPSYPHSLTAGSEILNTVKNYKGYKILSYLQLTCWTTTIRNKRNYDSENTVAHVLSCVLVSRVPIPAICCTGWGEACTEWIPEQRINPEVRESEFSIVENKPAIPLHSKGTLFLLE